MKKLEKVIDYIVLSLVTCFSILMVAVVFAQVVCRYVFNNPLYWSEECARYCFVYIVFCGGAWAGKEFAHLGVDYLVSKFSPSMQLVVEIFIDVLILGFSAVIIVISLITIPKIATQLSPAMNLPMCYPYAAIPIGFSFLLYYYILHLIDHIRTLSKGNIKVEGDIVEC